MQLHCTVGQETLDYNFHKILEYQALPYCALMTQIFNILCPDLSGGSSILSGLYRQSFTILKSVNVFSNKLPRFVRKRKLKIKCVVLSF